MAGGGLPMQDKAWTMMDVTEGLLGHLKVPYEHVGDVEQYCPTIAVNIDVSTPLSSWGIYDWLESFHFY